ncbi:T9SS type A sorting domain-containing protein [Psychroflexus sp. CAK57W]|uniref:T9SS type A sorting domain-containing protein n=1 Tax=Psychroflexus curvus TaxID=2873595 RepID=UPI001CCBEC30|nr:T9SS type A sorting domain-containing protein [Psychroflexus curvus]MBZ9786401.1 T9SS type A sorting domain-containing protein [Psychroflexus curvus]
MLSNNDVVASAVKLYPNPASNLIHLEGIENPERIEIFNLQGKLLLSRSGVTTVDVSSLAKGIYIFRASHNRRKIIKKMIKK